MATRTVPWGSRRHCKERGPGSRLPRVSVSNLEGGAVGEVPAQQKTPLRGGGALLGLLQGGEICISIYVDPWEVGEPSGVVGARCGKHLGPYVRRGTRPKSFVFLFLSVAPTESLTSVRTYVRNVCESGHTELLFRAFFPCSHAESGLGSRNPWNTLYTRLSVESR